MKKLCLIAVVLMCSIYVEAAPIQWPSQMRWVTSTVVGGTWDIETFAYNLTLNDTSGTITSFTMDPTDTNNVGTETTNPNSLTWSDAYGFAGSGDLISANDIGATTDPLRGNTNEDCTLIEDNGFWILFTCEDQDTFNVHRYNRTLIFFPSYYDFYTKNVTTLQSYCADLSYRNSTLNNANTIIYNATDRNHAILVYTPTDTIDNLFIARRDTDNCLDKTWQKGIQQEDMWAFRCDDPFGSNRCDLPGWHVGVDPLVADRSNTRAEFWNDLSSGDMSISGCSLDNNFIRFSQVNWAANSFEDVPQFYIDILDFSDPSATGCVGSAETRIEDRRRIYKFWDSIGFSSSEFSGSEYNRSLYYANQTHIFLMVDQDSQENFNFPTGVSYMQVDPILTQWYDRNWENRLVINITPGITTLHPDRINLSVTISDSFCDAGDCSFANTRAWSLVNDMQEEVDFKTENAGSNANIYFQGYQLYSGNQTSYFLYINNNTSVTDRNDPTGDNHTALETFTFSHEETIINNASLSTVIIPPSIPFNQFFDVESTYLCSPNTWNTCTVPNVISGANCKITIDGDTFTLSFDGSDYAREFQAGEESGILSWNSSCILNQFETRTDSGILTITTPCGFNEDALENLECALDGTKGFFLASGVGMTGVFIALGLFGFIVAIFSVFAGGRI